MNLSLADRKSHLSTHFDDTSPNQMQNRHNELMKTQCNKVTVAYRRQVRLGGHAYYTPRVKTARMRAQHGGHKTQTTQHHQSANKNELLLLFVALLLGLQLASSGSVKMLTRAESPKLERFSPPLSSCCYNQLSHNLSIVDNNQLELAALTKKKKLTLLTAASKTSRSS